MVDGESITDTGGNPAEVLPPEERDAPLPSESTAQPAAQPQDPAGQDPAGRPGC